MVVIAFPRRALLRDPGPLRALCLLSVAIVALFGEISISSAQDRVLVLRGKELVVSYSPARSSIDVGTYAVEHLRLPTNLHVRKIYPSRNIAIVSTASSIDVEPAPVEIDRIDVERVCQEVLDANRGIPLSCGANVFRSVSMTPNDPQIPSQYALSKLKASAAWNITTGSPGVVIAIVDSGVLYNHPDLSGSTAINTAEIPGNSVDDDGNGYVDDYFGYDFYSADSDPTDENGHGTHCAGIAAARGDNGIGGAGIAWGASVLPVRVLGPTGGGYDSDVAAGIQYAAQRGASIISLSLGGPEESAIIDNAIDFARSWGILVVAAAGNESANNDSVPSYPANSPFDNVISVAATNPFDELWADSNYGVNTVHVAAPGQAILSTYMGNSYATLSGTSMATPYVAGVAALMKSANGTLSYSQIRSGLFQSIDQLNGLSGMLITEGRINAHRAVVLAATGSLPAATPTPTPRAAPGSGSPRRILSLASKRYGRQALVYGYLKNSSRVAVAKQYVYLKCPKIVARRARSDADGYFAFRVARPRRAERCYAHDRFKNKSRSITVR